MHGGRGDLEVFLSVRLGGRAARHPCVGVNECQVLPLRGGHLGLHRPYHERKDPMYDIALNCAQSIRSIVNQGSARITAMVRSTRTRAKTRLEAPKGILYSKVRAFYPVADNR